uniref:Ig-like domain-containing protein n=1 Tax=Xenopus tropicalis TaxID=8364 RepID=A0A6I8RY31_XENTR
MSCVLALIRLTAANGLISLFLCLLSISLCAGGIHSKGKKPYCSIQNESVRVREGDSVTIPCWFSYPRNQWDSSISLRVYWRAARERPCGSNPFIYNHTENWVHGDYRGRISLKRNPKEQNVVSLRIQGIRRSDGPMFCCRLEPEGKTLKPWQNIQGTFIHFSGIFILLFVYIILLCRVGLGQWNTGKKPSGPHCSRTSPPDVLKYAHLGEGLGGRRLWGPR